MKLAFINIQELDAEPLRIRQRDNKLLGFTGSEFEKQLWIYISKELGEPELTPFFMTAYEVEHETERTKVSWDLELGELNITEVKTKKEKQKCQKQPKSAKAISLNQQHSSRVPTSKTIRKSPLKVLKPRKPR